MSQSNQQPQPELRTGKGVRIAVIDSGVNVRHPHIHRVSGGASVPISGDIEEGSYVDVLGHGTAVMAAIQEKAPNAEYIAVKLFHDTLRTSTEALFRSIEWAIERRVDLVNLSLGALEFRFADRFRELVERGLQLGVTLISAYEANGQKCMPGCLSGVIAVGLDWDCGRDRFRCLEGPVFYTSGYPRSLPGVSPARNLHGVSFAVANMTGMVARICETVNSRTPAAITAALEAECRVSL